MTIPFNKNYGFDDASRLPRVVLNVMGITMALLAVYAYGYAALLHTGVLYLTQTSTSSLTPIQQWVVGGHLCMAGLFATQMIRNIENWRAALYGVLMVTMLIPFVWAIIHAG